MTRIKLRKSRGNTKFAPLHSLQYQLMIGSDIKQVLTAETIKWYLSEICSRATTRNLERPAANMQSSRPRTWGSIAGPMAFAKFPTQVIASWDGLPLRGAICKIG